MINKFNRLIATTAAFAAVCCISCSSDSGEDIKPTTDPETHTIEIKSTSLKDGEVVAVDLSKIDIVYSTPISIAKNDDITLKSSDSENVDISVVAKNMALSISLLESLDYESSYTLTVAEGAVQAKSSGAKGAKFTLTFSSEEKPFVVDPTADFNIKATLKNPNATAEAVALYDYLREGFGKRTLSAAMCKYTVQTTEAEWMKEISGKYPAIICYDFMNSTRDYSWDVSYDEMITSAKDWCGEGGVVAAMWHWRDPSRKTDAFYSKNNKTAPETTSFDVSKVNDTESAEYKAMVEDIDHIAGYLKQLQDLKIPVLWRPLHEAQGAWFWWGAGSAEDTKALWNLLYDRLANHHGLNNLIWVWTVDKMTDAHKWYPGDDMVDILGTDIYNKPPTHDSRRDYFDFVATIGSHTKLVTLSECGVVPSPENMLEGGDTWSWFMPWLEYAHNENNGEAFMKEILNNDFVITRDEVDY